jgi:hypothetical protein
MNRYEPNGILQYTWKGIVYAALGGMMMRKERECQLCGEEEPQAFYPLQLCDGTWLILCGDCLHSGGTFQGCKKVIEKYFKAD